MNCNCGHPRSMHLALTGGRCGVLTCDCLWFEETTQKVTFGQDGKATRTKAIVEGPEKCTHCFRRTDGKCGKCAAPVCPIHAWATPYPTEMDLCRPCRDSAVGGTNDSDFA